MSQPSNMKIKKNQVNRWGPATYNNQYYQVGEVIAGNVKIKAGTNSVLPLLCIGHSDSQ